MIKSILFDYIYNIEVLNIDQIIHKVDYIFDSIKYKLYNDIPIMLVKNSVNIFQNKYDEAEYSILPLSEILSTLIDYMITTSPININKYTSDILKNNLIQYYDTYVYKYIYSWNNSIESIYLYHINHYRLLNSLNIILN